MSLCKTCCLFCAMLLLQSCSVEFEPFADSETYYTIAGYLDTDRAQQVVRVIPIRDVVQRPDSAFASVPSVRSLDLNSNDSIEWRDSVVVLDDGSAGLVFVADFRPIPTHRYRLSVRGNRGETTAEVTVPATPANAALVHTIAYPSVINYPLFWPGADEIIAVDVFYAVRASPPRGPAEALWFSYDGERRGKREAGDWRTDLLLAEDRAAISKVLETSDDVLLDCLILRISQSNSGWQPPPGGVFDADVLVQPGVFSNVSNGLGWFGAVSRASRFLVPINIPPNVLDGVRYLAIDRTEEYCLELADSAWQDR